MPITLRGGAHRGARRRFRAEEQTEERVTISARRNLRAQHGGAHRGARLDFRAEEQTEERVTISVRHDMRTQRGGEH